MNTSISTAITSIPLFPFPLHTSNSRYRLDMELKLVLYGVLCCYNRKPKNRVWSYFEVLYHHADGAKDWKTHWLTRDVHLLALPMMSKFRANFSARICMQFTELVQIAKNTFSSYSLTTTGNVGIFSHLRNCPALLLYNLNMILIALQPVEKQCPVRVPLVLRTYTNRFFVIFCNNGTSRKKEPTGGVLGGVWTHVFRFKVYLLRVYFSIKFISSLQQMTGW